MLRWYQDGEARFVIKACFLECPSNDIVRRMDRLANLMADASALTELWFEEKAELSQHPKVILPLQNKTFDPCVHLRYFAKRRNSV